MTQTITAMKAFGADAFLVAMNGQGAESHLLRQDETMVVKHSGAFAANDGLPILEFTTLVIEAVGLWRRPKKFTECPIYGFGLLEGCEMATMRNDLKTRFKD